MNLTLTPVVSRHRSAARSADVLGVQLGVGLILATAVCVVAPPLVAGLTTVMTIGPLWALSVRAERMERMSAPCEERPVK